MSEEIKEMTEEEKKQWEKDLKRFVIPGLRRMSYRWPARNEAIKAARIDRGVYKCAECGTTCKPKEFTVDHIDPVVSTERGFTNWDDYVKRMFPPKEGFQIICKLCDESKTAMEDSLRAEYNRIRKEKEAELKKQEKALTKKKKKDTI